MTKRPVVIGVVNDIHAGSTVAVCTPEVELDDGQFYRRSKVQGWLADCWDDYWRQVEEKRKAEKADFYLVVNGDAVEGDHHRTSQIISRNMTAQKNVVGQLLQTPLALKPERIIIVRGTSAHTGEAAEAEENIAAGMLKDGLPVVECPDTGKASWWHPVVDIHNTRLDIAHEGRAGHREHTRQSAMSLYAHDILLTHVKDGDQPPDLCLRAHYHRWADSYDACQVRVVTNAAWQLKTSFTHQKKTDSMANIGGIILTIRPDAAPADYDLRKISYKASRGTVCRLA